jgi:inhibitor of KinA
MLSFEIYALGDRGLTVSFGNIIDEKVNQTCIAFAEQLKTLELKGIRDVIPAYSTVSVYYDPLVIRQLPGVTNAQTALSNKVKTLLTDITKAKTKTVRQLTVPVCYDISLAPDLQNIADAKQISVEEVIALHTGKSYRVYMLGFLPGFPYMGTVDEKISTARKQQPFPIAAGSVGIAGIQTGIYPLDSPGGWNIIGRTPVKLFDQNNAPLTYFQPGDEVRFESISLTEFKKITQ